MGGRRKAWNEAMQNENTVARPQYRRSRREKARKYTHVGGRDGGAEGVSDVMEFRAAIRMDSLEDVVNKDDLDAEQEEYDELEDLEGGSGGSRKKRKVSNTKSKPKPGGNGKVNRKSKCKSGMLPERFRPRSLASILIEEVAWVENGVVGKYLKAEVKGNVYPSRKFCPVTGLLGIYTDPKSNIPFANGSALEQIRERAPPWISRLGGVSGSAAYYETCKSLKE